MNLYFRAYHIVILLLFIPLFVYFYNPAYLSLKQALQTITICSLQNGTKAKIMYYQNIVNSTYS